MADFERLQAAEPRPGATPDAALTTRVSELEGELEALRGDRDGLARQHDSAQRELATAREELRLVHGGRR